jgi:ribosomal protein S18 acetylase RimI-like enzyme
MLEADGEAIGRIESEVYPRPWPPAALADHLRSGSYQYWVATSESKTVGYLGLRTGPAALITTVTTVAWSWQHAVARIRLEVGVENDAARQLYEGAGFRSVGLRHGYYGAGLDAVIMELRKEG